jgi:hypothetical protein
MWKNKTIVLLFIIVLLLKAFNKTGQIMNFFLDKYPEECKHRQFLDLDANVSEPFKFQLAESRKVVSTITLIKVITKTV